MNNASYIQLHQDLSAIKTRLEQSGRVVHSLSVAYEPGILLFQAEIGRGIHRPFAVKVKVSEIETGSFDMIDVITSSFVNRILGEYDL